MTLAPVVCFLAAAATLLAGYEPAGNVLAVRESANGADLILRDGFMARIQWMDLDIVRVHVARSQDRQRTLRAVADAPLRRFAVDITEFEDAVFITAPEGRVSVTKRPFRVFVTRPDNTLVTAELAPGLALNTENGSVLTRLAASQEDGFYGLGMNGGHPNRRGQRIWGRNTALAAYEENTSPLHLGFPFFYSIGQGRALGVFVDNPAGPVIDIDTAGDGSLLLAGAVGGLDYYLLLGPRPSQVANAYARLTGFQPLPPRWALGYHHSRFGFRSQEEILSISRRFREHSIPLDAVHLDLDYMKSLLALTWDPVTFPSPWGMYSSLRQLGVRTVNIVEPCLLTADPLYLPMAQKDMLLRGADRLPYTTDLFLGRVGWIDFGYQPARDWFRERLAAFLRTGVDGIWNDLNEPADNYMPETVTHRVEDTLFSHTAVRNLYPVQQTSLSYSASLDARPNARPFVLSRAGSPGIQRYAANWSGDTLTSFDSLRLSVRMTISMGLSGQNLFGHDVGGFLGTPSPELLVRWMQFGAFTPYFRNHANRDTGPREPWAYGEPYSALIRDSIREHYRLLPYLYTLFEEASRTGAPVVAPTAYHFPSDRRTHQQSYEYMLGPLMLVAPVVEQGASNRPVYLPAGSDWVDYHTGAPYQGGQLLQVPLEIGRIPVFVRSGTILPKADGRLRNAEDNARAPLQVDFYPGPAMIPFDLYEDDGESFDYRAGAFERTVWSRRPGPDGQIRIEERRSPDSRPRSRVWLLRLLGQKDAPVSVRDRGVAGGALIQVSSREALDSAAGGWYHDAAEESILIRVESVQPVSIEVAPARR